MKKIILLKLDLQDVREKRKALKTVTALAGIDEILMDMKGKKLTITGTVDPVSIVSKLRKFWWTEILLVEPTKEPEKTEETKKEEPKVEEPPKGEPKKEEPPKGEPKKEEPPKEETKKEKSPKEEPKEDEPPKEEIKKEEPKREEEKEEESQMKEMKKAQPQPMPLPQPQVGMVIPYRQYYPPMHTYYQVHHGMEENPNACSIS